MNRSSGVRIAAMVLLLVWGFAIAAIAIDSAAETSLWWLLLIFGLAAPVVVFMLFNWMDRGRSASTKTQVMQPPESTGVPEPLSSRELDVLRLMAAGRTNAEIGQELFIATGTVKTHINTIYRKLGVRNRSEAAAVARAQGLLIVDSTPA